MQRSKKKIARSLADLLKPGGKILYSVCTVTQEETREVITAILDECHDLEKDCIHSSELADMAYCLSHDGYIETFPAPDKLLVDGFFAVRMVKKKKCE